MLRLVNGQSSPTTSVEFVFSLYFHGIFCFIKVAGKMKPETNIKLELFLKSESHIDFFTCNKWFNK